MPPLVFLREKYAYDPDQGMLYRRMPSGLCRVGTKMQNHGGLKCKIMQKMYAVHRVVYYMYYGIDPADYVIDHINRDRFDNRIRNLRAVSQSINNFNRKKLGGVRRNHDTWQAYFTLNKKFYTIGNYRTKKDAEAARSEFQKNWIAETLTNPNHFLQIGTPV